MPAVECLQYSISILFEGLSQELADGPLVIHHHDDWHYGPPSAAGDGEPGEKPGLSGRAKPVSSPSARGAGPTIRIPSPSTMLYACRVRSKSEKRILSTQNSRCNLPSYSAKRNRSRFSVKTTSGVPANDNSGPTMVGTSTVM